MAEDIDIGCTEEQDVIQRMQLAGLAFFHMFGLFAGVGAPLDLKTCVWNALVRPVLLYGCGSRGLTTCTSLMHTEALHITLKTPLNPNQISLAKAHADKNLIIITPFHAVDLQQSQTTPPKMSA